MDYENFKSLISLMKDQWDSSNKAYKLGIDLLDYNEKNHRINKILLREIMTPDGIDWFEWYLYEKKAIEGTPDKSLKAWDSKKKEICYDVKSLYNYLVENKYFRILNNE